MKGHSMKAIASAVLALLTALFSACTFHKNEVLSFELPENEIILINRYVNYAWGYDNSGIFIDSSGGVYSFDFSQEICSYNRDETEGDYLEKLQTISKYADPFVTLDEDTLCELYSYISGINKAAEFSEEFTACDAGEHQLKVYDTTAQKWVLCREEGDYTGELKDASAQKLLSFYDETVQPIIQSGVKKGEIINPETGRREVEYCEKYIENKTYYYTDKDVHIENIHCGYTKYTGKYVITNAEQLARFTEQTGIDFSDDDWSGSFPSDYFVYFVEIVDVSNLGYDFKMSGIMCKGGEFWFISSPDSKTPEPGMLYADAMDGFCFVAEFPKWTAMQFKDEENGCYNSIWGHDKWIEP